MCETSSDVRIRAVGVFKGRAREAAEEKNLDENDLVILRTYISKENPLPRYEVEKIEGEPVSYLFDKPRMEAK